MPFKNPSTEVESGEVPAASATQPVEHVISPPAARPYKHGLLSSLRSYFIVDPLIWAYTVILGLISIPVSLFGDRERILHNFARAWSWMIMKTIFSPVKVTGLDKIDTTRTHVYAVNHASALDIPVLYVYLPFQFRIAFKKELLAYPIVGWHLKRSGQICVDQQNPAGSIGSIRSALKSLKAGMQPPDHRRDEKNALWYDCGPPGTRVV